MIGKRHDMAEDEYSLEQGEYGKGHEDGIWYFHVPAPGFGTGGLNKHTVVEHTDGTITVSPSILCYGHDDNQWHGWLEQGVWRQA